MAAKLGSILYSSSALAFEHSVSYLFSSGWFTKIVTITEYIDGSNKEEIARQMLESFKTIGFVYLVNHGLPEEKISSMFEWSRKLFDLPHETKQLAPHPESGVHHRGYSAPGREKVIQFSDSDETTADDKRAGSSPKAAVLRDMKESFECGREDDVDMPNIWFPDGVFTGFKEACLDFYWACFDVEKLILRVLATGFNLPDEYFIPFHSNADNQLRLLHYPSIEASLLKDEQSSRIPSHTDFCSITLLMQDDIGGLEVEDPNQPGVFVPVPPIPGSIVVNAGDFLMRWSNDTIKSTVHRVRIPPLFTGDRNTDKIPSRYSIPYFCASDLTTVVDCIPGTWSEDKPKRYPPISAMEYITKRLAANY